MSIEAKQDLIEKRAMRALVRAFYDRPRQILVFTFSGAALGTSLSFTQPDATPVPAQHELVSDMIEDTSSRLASVDLTLGDLKPEVVAALKAQFQQEASEKIESIKVSNQERREFYAQPWTKVVGPSVGLLLGYLLLVGKRREHIKDARWEQLKALRNSPASEARPVGPSQP